MLVAEAKELATYKNRIYNIWSISKKEAFANGLMFGGFQFTGYLSLTTVLFYGSRLIDQGVLTYGDLSSFCLYAVLCAASLSNISSFYIEMMKGLGASSRLFELKDQKPQIPLTGARILHTRIFKKKHLCIVGGLKINDIKREVRFENVSFAYPDRPPLFTDVTFRVPAGKVVAVVGPSGSGKSTIASMLLR